MEDESSTVDAAVADINPEDWAAGVPPAEQDFRLEDDNPEALASLKAAGYQGDVWFRVRALTAAEMEDRQTRLVQFHRDGDAIAQKWSVSGEALLRFNIERMIVDGEFSVWRNGAYRPQRWDKAAGRSDNNVNHVLSMGKGLLAWLLEKLDEVSGEELEERVEQAKNASGA